MSRIYDDGWYFIHGLQYRCKVNCHYFYKDKLIHGTSSNYFGPIDVSKKSIIKESEQRRCKRCLIILDTYQDLDNRPI